MFRALKPEPESLSKLLVADARSEDVKMRVKSEFAELPG